MPETHTALVITVRVCNFCGENRTHVTSPWSPLASEFFDIEHLELLPDNETVVCRRCKPTLETITKALKTALDGIGP
jgi:predicted metal-dependent hydrolase